MTTASGLTLHTWLCIDCDAFYNTGGAPASDSRKAVVRAAAIEHSDAEHHRVRVTTTRKSHETIIPAPKDA